MPMMPFIGVRISWLMVARNSAFTRLALLARSRARRRSLIAPSWLSSSRLIHSIRQANTTEIRMAAIETNSAFCRQAARMMSWVAVTTITSG